MTTKATRNAQDTTSEGALFVSFELSERSYWDPGSFETSSSMSEPSNALPRFRVVSLSCCDVLHSILETGVRWYAVGQGTLRAPDTPATPPSSRHDLSGPLPWLGSQVATYAAIQLHGSAPALATVLASSCAVTRNGNTPTTTTVVFRTTSGPWRTRSCAVLSADYSDAVSSCPARQNWC